VAGLAAVTRGEAANLQPAIRYLLFTLCGRDHEWRRSAGCAPFFDIAPLTTKLRAAHASFDAGFASGFVKRGG